MGYAHYTITRNGEDIDAGYGVEAVCEQDRCAEEIDRGLYYLCGDTPGSGRGCGGYFCAQHLLISFEAAWEGQLCPKCATEAAEEYERDQVTAEDEHTDEGT